MKRILLTLTWLATTIVMANAQSGTPQMTLSSTAFEDGAIIPVKYSQAAEGAAPGGGTSPALSWANVPASTLSLPEGVPAGTKLSDGSYQVSVTGPLYRGPGAAANGPLHHYTFELFALDITLDKQPAADAFQTRAMIMKAMQGHILARCAYTGRFRRPQ